LPWHTVYRALRDKETQIEDKIPVKISRLATQDVDDKVS
jgi:hypothetical protein